jgi:hypothetical protein
VIDGLPADAMHDILEGVLQYECKEMLKIFIKEEKYFTLEQLNTRIKMFDYGYYNDLNKPSPILQRTLGSENNSLRQKGIILQSQHNIQEFTKSFFSLYFLKLR